MVEDRPEKFWDIEVVEDYSVLDVCLLLLAAYIAYRVLSFLLKKCWSIRLRMKAEACLAARNARIKAFNLEGVDVDKILNLDTKQMREELIKGSITSVHLVNCFGERCQRIGRNFNLSAEENFETALRLAEEKDRELQDALQKGEAESLPLLHGIPIAVVDSIN